MKALAPVKLAPLSAGERAAYLRVLGARPAEPSQTALGELVQAQVTRVPFESVSKLYYRHRGLTGIAPLELYLEGIERFHLGGTCYTINFHFCRLLQALGYEAALCGADMPSGEDVHAAIAVTIEGRDLLVDAGYAAPFLRPLPRDSAQEVVVNFGRDRYVLAPRDHEGRSRLDLHRGGERIHGYLFKPTPRPIEHFENAVRDSFRPAATFMSTVMLVRYTDSSAITIYNLTLIHSTADGFTTHSLADREDLITAIQREFAIPGPIARHAIEGLGPLGDAYH